MNEKWQDQPQDSGYYWVKENNKKYIGRFNKNKNTFNFIGIKITYYLDELVNHKFLKINEPNDFF